MSRSDQRKLSPDARALEEHYRDVIGSLTDAPVGTGRRRAWYRKGSGLAWWALAFFLVLFVTGFLLFGGFGGDGGNGDTSPTGVSTPTTLAGPAGGRWFFTAENSGNGLYTIDLLGDGLSGPVNVIEDVTETGAYTWSGTTLTIDFTRVLTMSTGFNIQEPSQFVCTGTPDDSSMPCIYHRQAWSYDGDTGLTIEGMTDWPARAERRG